ncbi:MAG: DUF5989 family protein [Planctomycetota bacterium]
MRAINVFLAIAISFLLAFFVLEGGLRLIGFGPPESINQFDDELGWVKTPGKSAGRSTGEFDISFDINSRGLRDDEDLKPEKQPSTYRVMMLGDSFVLGYTVDRQDLFVDQLEGWWSSEERRVEVINAGTEGYSTDQQVVWFREYGKEYKPDVVMLFPYLNDVYWNGQDSYNRFPKPRFNADGTLETGKLVDPGDTPMLAKLATMRFLGFLLAPKAAAGPHTFEPAGASGPVQREFGPLLDEEPTWLADAYARTRGALKALKADCADVGSRLIVCPIPPETAIHEDERTTFGAKFLGGLPESDWSPEKPVQRMLDMAAEEGIETMSPLTAFQTRAEEGERLYFKEEWHFNPDGNVALTNYLYSEFDSRGIFPEAHKAIQEGGIPEPEAASGIPTFVKVFAALWLLLTILYATFYRDVPLWQPPVGVFCLLALVFGIVIGGGKLLGMVPPNVSKLLLAAFVLGLLGFIAWKLGRRLATIAELLKAFTLRGHWYLMPLVVVLLTIGSLLVVAASSPLVAPFIYTLF